MTTAIYLGFGYLALGVIFTTLLIGINTLSGTPARRAINVALVLCLVIVLLMAFAGGDMLEGLLHPVTR